MTYDIEYHEELIFHLYFFFEYVYSEPLTILKLDRWYSYWFLSVVYHILKKSLSVICITNIPFQYMACIFILLTVIWRAEVVNFNESQLINFFMDHASS